ncbi:MAG: cell division protein FtsA [Patescibacteria group bacterium]|nr:cell division protein FtsA [Patescibacteria group bacterium]
MPKDKITAVIDIGSSKVCTVIANTVDGRNSVIGVSNIVSKGIRKGVVVDIDEAVESISQSLERAERMAGCSVSNVFVTVSGSHIESLNSHGVVAVSHQDAEIGEEDVSRVTEAAQAISLPSNREIIHVIPRDFIVDKQDGVRDPVGMSGIRLEVEVNIIHGSATALKNLTKCINQIGVDVSDLIYAALASAEATLTDTEKELGTILVDIGGGTTSIIVYIEGSPVYSSVLPVGGQNITNDLAIGLRTSLESAEKIKLKLSGEGKANSVEDMLKGELDVKEFGLETTTVAKKFLNDISKERLEELFRLVAVEIKKANCIGKLPAGVVITGGGAETYYIEKIARDVLRAPVRIAVPKGVSGLIDEINGAPFSSAVGAILYGAKMSKETGRFGSKGKMKITGFLGKIKTFVKSLLP